MTEQNVYALNTVSGTVAKVDAELLDHPTFGKHLIEVESPDVCIECGDQPDEVTTTEGETIDLVTHESAEEFDHELDAPELNEGEK